MNHGSHRDSEIVVDNVSLAEHYVETDDGVHNDCKLILKLRTNDILFLHLS